MATIFPLSRPMMVLPANSGNIAELGPAGASKQAGTWTIDILPDQTFVGSFAIVGRAALTTDQQLVPFATIPYRRIVWNGVASDGAMATDVITGRCIIQVPWNVSVGILMDCSAGFAWIYPYGVDGTAGV